MIKQARTGLETEAAGASTGTNSARAAEIVQGLEDNQVYMTPAATLKLFDDIVKGTTVADVNAAIAKSFRGSGPLVMLTASKAPAGGEATLKAEYEKASTAPVDAPDKDSNIVWPYTLLWDARDRRRAQGSRGSRCRDAPFQQRRAP